MRRTQSWKMFRASHDAALGKFFNERDAKAGRLRRICGQASLCDASIRDRRRSTTGAKFEIESGCFQFGRNDARAEPKLRHSGRGQLGHRGHRSKDLFQAVHAAAFVIDGEQSRQG